MNNVAACHLNYSDNDIHHNGKSDIFFTVCFITASFGKNQGAQYICAGKPWPEQAAESKLRRTRDTSSDEHIAGRMTSAGVSPAQLATLVSDPPRSPHATTETTVTFAFVKLDNDSQTLETPRKSQQIAQANSTFCNISTQLHLHRSLMVVSELVVSRAWASRAVSKRLFCLRRNGRNLFKMTSESAHMNTGESEQSRNCKLQTQDLV